MTEQGAGSPIPCGLTAFMRIGASVIGLKSHKTVQNSGLLHRIVGIRRATRRLGSDHTQITLADLVRHGGTVPTDEVSSIPIPV